MRQLPLLLLGISLCMGPANYAFAAPDGASDASTDVAAVDQGATDASAPDAAPAKSAKEKLAEVDTENPGELVGLLVSAFKNGQIAWGLALCFMLLTYLLRKVLLKWIPKKVLPWVAISLAMAVNMAASFSTGLKWYAALGNGLTMGLAAVGGWEAIGKLFKKSPKSESPAESASEGEANESPPSSTTEPETDPEGE